MGRSYTVNPSRKKYSSQLPYICSLLAFLIVLLLIYLLSYFLKASGQGEDVNQMGHSSGSVYKPIPNNEETTTKYLETHPLPSTVKETTRIETVTKIVTTEQTRSIPDWEPKLTPGEIERSTVLRTSEIPKQNTNKPITVINDVTSGNLFTSEITSSIPIVANPSLIITSTESNTNLPISIPITANPSPNITSTEGTTNLPTSIPIAANPSPNITSTEGTTNLPTSIPIAANPSPNITSTEGSTNLPTSIPIAANPSPNITSTEGTTNLPTSMPIAANPSPNITSTEGTTNLPTSIPIAANPSSNITSTEGSTNLPTSIPIAANPSPNITSTEGSTNLPTSIPIAANLSSIMISTETSRLPTTSIKTTTRNILPTEDLGIIPLEPTSTVANKNFVTPNLSITTSTEMSSFWTRFIVLKEANFSTTPTSSTPVNKFTTPLQAVTTKISSSTPSSKIYLRFMSTEHNDYSVCTNLECKKFAAEVLVKRSYEAFSCDNFYQYTCGGTITKDIYSNVNEITNGILKKIHSKSDVPDVFKNFYLNCRNSDLNYHVANNKYYERQNTMGITDLLIELTLLQTLNFFEVTLNIDDDKKFIIEITQLNLFKESLLKTTVSTFSIFEYFRSRCIDLIGETYSLGKEKKINAKLLNCAFNKIEMYVKKYCLNIKCQSESLDALLDLLKLQRKHIIFNQDEKIPIIYKISNLKNILDLDWLTYLKALTNNRVSEGTIIHLKYPNYFEELNKKFKSYSEQLLKNVLLIWHQIQSERNAIAIIQENSESSCLNAAMELMPDVGNYLINNQLKQNGMGYSIFNDLKRFLLNYYSIENFNSKYRSFLGTRIGEMEYELMVINKYQTNHYEKINIKLMNFELFNWSNFYFENVEVLMKNYRKLLFSFVGQKTTRQILLQYFISPLSKQPKAFPQLNVILIPPQFSYRYEFLPSFVQIAKIGYPILREMWKLILSDKVIFIHDSKMYETLRNALFANHDDDYSQEITEATEYQLIIENAAFRSLTEYFQRQPLKKPDIIYLSSLKTTSAEIYLLAAIQGLCKKDRVRASLLDASKNIVPSEIIVSNIAKNSEFFYKTFKCDMDNVSFNAQFPFVRVEDFSLGTEI